MNVWFQRTGQRRYAVQVRRPDGVLLRMEPAPGFDQYLPHDLQHFIVEEQLGLSDAIFGRLAAGGSARTFRLVGSPTGQPGEERRDGRRHARRLARHEVRLRSPRSADQMGRSERATIVAWHDWLAHAPEPELRQQGDDMRAGASQVLEAMRADDRATLHGALPRLRLRIDDLGRQWAATPVGSSLAVTWFNGR